MWIWAYLLLGVAIFSGILGFGDIIESVSFVARFIFGVSMFLFSVALLIELSRAPKEITETN